jgi:hypothetical protein
MPPGNIFSNLSCASSFVRHTGGNSIINLKHSIMKEFMFIFKAPYYEDLNLSAQEAESNMYKWINWVKQLRSEGVYVEGRPLMKGGKIVSGKNAVATDGPFAESKELVGGYFIVKANNIEEAIKLTKGYPDFDINGSIEVREVMVVPKPAEA